MHELVDEARLPHARLTNERCDLAMSRPRPLQRLLQGRQALLPAHKTGEPPRRAGLQTPPESTRPDRLTHLHGLGQTLDRKPSQRLDLDESLG